MVAAEAAAGQKVEQVTATSANLFIYSPPIHVTILAVILPLDVVIRQRSFDVHGGFGCMSAFAGAKGSGKTSIGELTDCRLEWELYGCLVSFQGGSHGGETGSTGRKT